MVGMVHDLNIAAAQGKQFVMMTELRDGTSNDVSLSIQNITRIRDLGDSNIFAGTS